MTYSVERLESDKWIQDSELAHRLSFDAHRSKDLERIDFALVTMKDSKPHGYVTCIEMDSETVYWQIGGAFPNAKGTGAVVPCYIAMVDWCLERYRRITTRIENTNVAMLRLAMKVGFLIVGTWNFKGKIYLELLLEGESWQAS